MVTNTHVIQGILKDPSDPILLFNENQETLEFDKLLFGASVDLALFTTKQSVSSYLKIEDVTLSPKDQLFALGYADGILTQIDEIDLKATNKTSFLEGIPFTEKFYFFDFPTKFSFYRISGMSGAPVFNQNCQLVGIASQGGRFLFYNNITYIVAIKLKYLQQMLRIW